MSNITAVPLRPVERSTVTRLVLGLVLILGAAFLLAFAGTKPLRGVKTPGGVIVRTVKAGTGPKIGVNDGVLIEYTGKLTDGTVFDQTQGQPVPMLVGRVVPGFSEALQQMQNGGSYRIRIPSKLAYGASPPPGGPIPPNADLDFDVKVARVVPNAAVIAAQQQMQQMIQQQQQQQGAAGAPQPPTEQAPQ
ncbi:FKBP-type peptidyl-prolyl cis-trans isomerase [Sphingomonas ginkgonis]|uniref:Peptidyl-prolyl cis-trans isomerase n=1 Tax=Sphingomonas ginkgonis TaxID=2315330 RepID=A0A429V6K3_9SPHN|nr:FKBP-type peptidyl-prolyl cis-trans isomerase [Sphingomonas ginkgonis]RST29563.1 FKBP-type peptidyl-prolyl cis-trans isomerase [Sphingomonas ginkgonis]